ncbi:MAG TPA: hypothetical protein VHA75_04085, partial [Rugosimonospora sp.]|nr:hypothetical protein [Rugosimonospora sp.]
LPAGPPAPRPAINGNGARPGPEVETRAGLTRRRPGTHMAPGLLVGQPAATAPAVPTAPADPGPQRDPESERAQLDSLFAGFQRGETSQQPAVTQQPPVEGPS